MRGRPPELDLPALVQTHRFVFDPYELFRHGVRAKGPIFSVRLLGLGRYVICCDQRAAAVMLGEDTAKYHSGEGLAPLLNDFLGEHSLLTVDGPEHRRLRRWVLAPMTPSGVARHVETVARVVRRDLAASAGREVRLTQLFQGLTLDAFAECFLGAAMFERHPRLRPLVFEYLDCMNGYLLLPFLRLRVSSRFGWGRFLKLRLEWREIVAAEIRYRRRAPGGGPADLLQHLVDDGEDKSDAEIGDALLSLIIGGYETTSATLTWCACMLQLHPEVKARARAEVEKFVGAEVIEPAHLERLPYVRAVFQEALRLFPVPALIRIPKELVQVGDHRIAPGDYDGIGISPAMIHRSPEIYPEPERFLPERFLGDPQPAPGCFLSFGGGHRGCPGGYFASMEGTVALAELLRGYEIRLAPGQSFAPARRFLMVVPRGGARGALLPRAATG